MITVLLAAYNGEKYIAEQLDSILNQTEKELQIVISDDGSDDGTVGILEQYREREPHRIRLLFHKAELSGSQERHGEKNMGNVCQIPAAAMNFFWLLSQTDDDYVMFCDQDDVWLENKAEILLKRMKELEGQRGKEHPILIHSDMKVVDEHLNLIAESFFKYQNCNPERTSFSEILTENPVTGGAVMINRALAVLLRELPAACCMHDWWTALTASCFGTVACVREPLYLYRQHGGNTLGAKATGNIKDLRERIGRTREVEERYRKMFMQAKAFGAMHERRLTAEQKNTLRAYLALPLQSPLGRLYNIKRNHFTKSSRIQTIAQCITIPHPGGGDS